MISIEAFRELALSFPETTEQPHFEKTSFRVGKKIFATLDIKVNKGFIKLSLADQDIFSTFDKKVIHPVPNKWGTLGWTTINLKLVPKKLFAEALTIAYCEVAPKKLAALVRPSTS